MVGLKLLEVPLAIVPCIVKFIDLYVWTVYHVPKLQKHWRLEHWQA